MSDELLAAVVTFISGSLLTGIAMVVRDAVMKNTFKHKIQLLELSMAAQEKVDEKQDAEIRTIRENQIAFRETMHKLQENFTHFYELQRDEVKGLTKMMSENNQRMASLDATMKGIGHWLERVEERLNKEKK